MAKQEDPRYLRVRGRLSEALLELASTKPVSSISVSELTTAAGVSRASFYSHASSPSALLADILVQDLRARFDELDPRCDDPDSEPTAPLRRLNRAFCDHVRDYRQVHQIILQDECAVAIQLVGYLEEALGPYVEAALERMGDGVAGDPLWVAVARLQSAHNMVALMRAWMLTGMKDEDRLVEMSLSLPPLWHMLLAKEQRGTEPTSQAFGVC